MPPGTARGGREGRRSGARVTCEPPSRSSGGAPNQSMRELDHKFHFDTL